MQKQLKNMLLPLMLMVMVALFLPTKLAHASENDLIVSDDSTSIYEEEVEVVESPNMEEEASEMKEETPGMEQDAEEETDSSPFSKEETNASLCEEEGQKENCPTTEEAEGDRGNQDVVDEDSAVEEALEDEEGQTTKDPIELGDVDEQVEAEEGHLEEEEAETEAVEEDAAATEDEAALDTEAEEIEEEIDAASLATFSATASKNRGYQKGDRSKAISGAKKKLNSLGFGGIKVTNFFGNFTKKRVKEFQAYYGLKVTGRLDQATLTTLSSIYDSPLQYRKRDQKMIQLKHQLNHLGYGKIKVTNYFGRFTERKVKQYQRNNNLPVSGIIEPNTEKHIIELFSSTYQLGGRNEQVKQLKRNLNSIGFGRIKVTSLYGSFTAKRVKQFQEYYGLNATGKADVETLNKAEQIATSPFQLGVRNRQTLTLKRHLNQLGFGRIKVTSLYGNYTEKRVKDFQKYYGLKVTGVADPRTFEKINDLITSPFQKGKRHKETITFKRNLNRLGFNGIKVTTLYGSFTAKRVKDFQKYYGLVRNGIIDAPTKTKMEEILSSPLQRGKRHEELIDIKRKLNNLGYGYIKETNYFGSFSERQVKRFQRDEGLPVSGIIDDKTKQAILSHTIKIFIDPGHGGRDPGASAFGISEKDVVLDIALEASRYLTRHYRGVEVRLSRSDDRYIPLEERAKMANDWNADYFTSIHINAGKASGFESYIHRGKNDTIAAQNVQKSIHSHIAKNVGVRDRGMKKANFNVLRNTTMPAILLEFLFIDNAEENKLLKQRSYRQTLGRLTAEAIAITYQLEGK